VTVRNRFLLLGFFCLSLSLILGLAASLQYFYPRLLSDRFSFQKTRPLHVFLAINWIFACVSGLIYNCIGNLSGKGLFSTELAKLHFALHLATVITAATGFCMGKFSGREYLEFPVWLTAVIIFYWLLFIINFVATMRPKLSTSPVYIWSWSTGLLFFLITFLEAHLWLLPYFNNNVVRDLTVQWKANGSMVGAWNMLIYGTSMYTMEQITGDKKIAYQRESFAFYFLSLTNLMFNWGHHTYVVPANPIIRQVAFGVSMSELVLLWHIIYTWKKNYEKSIPDVPYPLAYRFFKTADLWVFLNLALALAISVPYLNQYTHGTQITVAHAMGATIGINTILLLASAMYVVERKIGERAARSITWARELMSGSLLVFWLALITMGIIRGVGIRENAAFLDIAFRTRAFQALFSIAGTGLVVSTGLTVYHYTRAILRDDAEI